MFERRVEVVLLYIALHTKIIRIVLQRRTGEKGNTY